MMLARPIKSKADRDVRIAAVADYLLGKPVAGIVKRWGVSEGALDYWVRRAGFKLRRHTVRAKLRVHKLYQSGGH